jgi:tetratricopeptide (TPR) repeat protein
VKARWFTGNYSSVPKLEARTRQHGVVIFTAFLWLSSTDWLMASGAIVQAQAPTEAAVYVDRAVLAYETQQYTLALSELQEALRLDPDHLEALYYQGLVFIALGRLPDAQAAWERALTLRPTDVDDGVNYLVGPVHFFLFEAGRHYIKTGYQFDYDATEGDNWRYAGHHFLFGAQSTMPWGDVRLRYDLDLHLRFHINRHSFLPLTAPGTLRRHDREAIHLFSIAKDVSWRSQSFTVAVDYLIDDNSSNLAAYDYDRQVVTTSVTWRF